MNKFFKETISAHILSNRICYILALLSALIGIGIGIFSGINSPKDGSFLQSFLLSYTEEGLSTISVFTRSLLLNLRTVIIIWASSFFVWLLPLSFIQLGAKGFGIGFCFSYLILDGGFKGLCFSVSSLLIQSLILIPVLIIYTVLQVNFSGEFDKTRKSPSLYKERKKLLTKNALSLIFVLIPILFCGLIDAYLTPFFISFLL